MALDAQPLGIDSFVGFADQSVYGTLIATSTKFLPFKTEALKAESKVLPAGYAYGRSKRDAFQGHLNVAGDINFALFYEGWELLFKHAFGAVATVPVGGGAYQHTFTISDIDEEGLSINMNRDDRRYSYDTCIVSQLQFNMAPEAVLEGVFSFLGVNSVTGDAESPASLDNAGGSVDFDDFSLTLDPSGDNITIDIMEGSVTLNPNPDEGGYRLGARSRQRHARAGKIEVNVEFTRECDDTDLILTKLRDAWLMKIAKVLRFEWTGGSIGGQNYILRLDLPHVYFVGDEPAVGGEGPIPISFMAEGYYDAGGSAEPLTLVLINGITSGGF